MECSRKYKQVELSVYVTRMSNGYGKSFPPVRALASIANMTVHFRNANDLSRESSISSLVHRFLRKEGEHIFPIRISIIDPSLGFLNYHGDKFYFILNIILSKLILQLNCNVNWNLMNYYSQDVNVRTIRPFELNSAYVNFFIIMFLINSIVISLLISGTFNIWRHDNVSALR